MKNASALVALLACAPVAASAGELAVSPWVAFPEAQVRLLVDRAADGGKVRGGIEIRLAEGYKTYWRNPGDSGVPPVFDFGRSSGLKDVEVKFPFPGRFDDGAGGTAWGYKKDVILPLAAISIGNPYRLGLKLDFAVCGTMCIPLTAELALDPAEAPAADAETGRALEQAIARLPSLATGEAKVERASTAEARKWRVRLPYSGDPGRASAFAEANGFLDIVRIAPAGESLVEITLKGEASPGSGGRFGPVRLTYGEKAKAFERVIDLDGAALTP